MKNKFVIGTRGSVLALAQTNLVKSLLENNFPNFEFEVKIIVTTGDKDLTTAWGYKSNTSIKSFFTKEIEKELLDGSIDFAVHSMKDMPASNPPGLVFSGVPDRADSRDVFISQNNIPLLDLPPNPVIGTSSLRRARSIKLLRPDAIIKEIRGNIHTRLGKLDNKEYDGIVLAAAGLIRTDLAHRITHYFKPTEIIPAPSQGALCLQYKEGSLDVEKLLSSITNDNVTEIVKLEREFSRIFNGGCHTPIGCNIQVSGDDINIIGVYCSEEKYISKSLSGKLKEGMNLIEDIATSLKGEINE